MSTASLRASPTPTLVGEPQSSGRNFGIEVPSTGGGGGSEVIPPVVPSEPMVRYQQAPLFVGDAPNRNPSPRAICVPPRRRPTTLSYSECTSGLAATAGALQAGL